GRAAGRRHRAAQLARRLRDRPAHAGQRAERTGPAGRHAGDPLRPAARDGAGHRRAAHPPGPPGHPRAGPPGRRAHAPGPPPRPRRRPRAPDRAGGLLEPRSARQPGMVQAPDVLPTLLDLLGIDGPARLARGPMRLGDTSGTGAARIATLIDENRHAVAVRPLTAPFFSGLVLVNLALYGIVTVGLNRRFLDRAVGWLERRRASGWAGIARAARAVEPDSALRTLRAVAVTVAA